MIGQNLHHQQFASMGSSSITSKGIELSQTIGQQSICSMAKHSVYIVQQGFQQSLLKNNNLDLSSVKVVTKMFPNPFTTTIYFEFDTEINGEIEVLLFDDSGKMVYSFKNKLFSENRLTINPINTLSQGHYFVVLYSDKFRYSSQIFKTKL